MYTHRGSNPQDPNSLNTEEAAACLVILCYFLVFELMLQYLLHILTYWTGAVQNEGYGVKWTGI